MGESKLDVTIHSLWRGGSSSMVTRAHQAGGETLLIPERNFRKKGKFYNWFNRKWTEDERVAAGSERAMKWSNVHGAKGPCYE